MDPAIRVLPVAAAGISFMVLGSLWYGPLFAKPWLALIGKSRAEMEKAAKPSIYVWTFVGALVASHVLDHLLRATFAQSASDGATFRLWLIDAGYPVIALTVAGAVLGGWR